jgi:hypothetical protein
MNPFGKYATKSPPGKLICCDAIHLQNQTQAPRSDSQPDVTVTVVGFIQLLAGALMTSMPPR